MTDTVTVTVAHVRQAIASAKAGGTSEHPYSQRQWGKPECGTACCVAGLAQAIAGCDAWAVGPPRMEDTPEARTLSRLMWCQSPDILRVMDAVREDGTIGLRDADLQCADLQGANLQGADLQRANLQRANLQRANLQGANLQRANLRDANLQGANLQCADLQDAKLQGADLQGVIE